MTTDFHSAVGSGLATRRATSALYTGGTGQQQVTFLLTLQALECGPLSPGSQPRLYNLLADNTAINKECSSSVPLSPPDNLGITNQAGYPI
jgi:hypothetical protein